MKILLTGANGFIGKHVYNAIKDKHEVVRVSRTIPRAEGDRCSLMYTVPIDEGAAIWFNKTQNYFGADLTRPDLVRMVLDRAKPDVIVHLAASAVGKPNKDNPGEVWDANIKPTHYLAEYAPQGCRFVYMSTIVVYGDLPVKFHRFVENDQCFPTTPYAISKMAGELILETYSEKMNTHALRLCATVGTGLTHGVVKDFIRKLKENDELEMLGDYPGSMKPYIHVDDVVSAVELAIEGKIRYRQCNVCPDDNLSISYLAETVMSATNINKPTKWLGSAANWKGDNPEIQCSNILLKSCGWQPKYPTSFSAVHTAVKEIENESAVHPT